MAGTTRYIPLTIRAQMAVWAVLAAPLMMSVDLRTIKPEFKAILQHR